MKSGDKIKTSCEYCKGDRNHEVMAVVETHGNPDDYQFYNYDCIVKCCGCDYVSFLSRFVDLESGGYTDDGGWRNEISDTRYPYVFETITNLEDFYLVPEIVSNIYKETKAAIQSKSFIIAGAGMRAIIEAVCNDKDIKGRDLKTRINKLVTLGLVSKEDAKRLHAIRFLGNDSVHDIKPATKEALAISLRIVNHIIETVYTLQEASRIIDTSIESYEELKPFIQKIINNTKSGSVVTFRGLLGHNCRRIENLDAMETDFQKSIIANEIKDIAAEAVKDPKGKILYRLI